MYKKNIVIEPWMAEKTNLTGNKLILFALLWQESKQGKEEVAPDYNEVSSAMGTSTPTMYNCLNDLVRSGLLLQTGKKTYRVCVEK